MTQADLFGTLALVVSYLPPPARARVVEMLPEALREGIRSRQDVSAEDVGALPVVAQILKADLERHFGEAAQRRDDEAEVLPLRAADLLAPILMCGTPQQAAEIVRRLPAEVEDEVLHLIAAQTQSALVRRLGGEELALMQALGEALGRSEAAPNPVFAAGVLRHIQNPGILRRILTQMHDKDPDSTGQVQDLLFGFNDLMRLPDLELQTLLRGVDHWDLILALRPAPVALRGKVLANLSQRRVTLLEEDERVLEDVEDAQVKMVQQQIVDRARMLYETGAVHTYMGSIARDDADGSPDDAREAVPTGGGSIRPSGGRNTRRTYALSIVVGLGCCGLAVAFLIWFNGLHWSAPGPVGGARGQIGLADGDASADSAQEARPHLNRPSADIGSAAVVSGRALLVSGGTVRSSESGIQPGDTLKTGSDGRASVALGADSGQMQVEANSEVQFSKADNPQDAAPRLDLRVGNIWVQVKNPTLEVTSPLASVTGAEGAVYHLRIALNAATTLTVHKGTVWVKNKKASDSDFVVLGPGERLVIKPDGEVIRDRHNEPLTWQGAKP